ncbi:hypothetical protein Glove_606g135 [Diversispora epigaea]|uniref:Uncharacterized protein n=1 Tax=Diversispora epigaea TaxID=1348612 RepID=A0A397GD35_9GLOM|nr:hypothetical protein Glove_606g135 [Diversispora epigaea]
MEEDKDNDDSEEPGKKRQLTLCLLKLDRDNRGSNRRETNNSNEIILLQRKKCAEEKNEVKRVESKTIVKYEYQEETIEEEIPSLTKEDKNVRKKKPEDLFHRKNE